MTIASVCMPMYRANYRPSKSIAVVPEYLKTHNYSEESIQCLDYIAEKHNIQIQHAPNGG